MKIPIVTTENDSTSRSHSAFTLMEVMIAVAIFFSCMFAILTLVSSALRNARALSGTEVDPGVLAAEVAMTNRLYEGPIQVPGEIEDLYQNYTFDGQVMEVSSNGFFQVDLLVTRRIGKHEVNMPMSIQLYRPESPAGSATKGGIR